MNTIGSIAKATDQQIQAYCQQNLACESSDLVEQRSKSLTDLQTLEKLGVCAQRIFRALSTIIALADKALTQRNTMEPTVVFEGHKYKVYGLNSHAKMLDECLLCNYTKIGPRKLSIYNCSTGDNIKFIEPVLHEIEQHEYFGRPHTEYRIEPISACKMLGLKN